MCEGWDTHGGLLYSGTPYCCGREGAPGCAEQSDVVAPFFFLFSLLFLHDLVFVKPSNRFPVLAVMSERSWPPSFFPCDSTWSNKLTLTRT